MAFHEVQFPADIAFGATGGPAYATDIVELASGHEQRNLRWAAARARYNVAHGVKTQAQLEALIAFFRARKGRAHGFRFKDWQDYRAAGQALGTGDGAATAFQLVKHYTSGAVTETRVIKKPVAGTVKLYLDAVEQAGGWTVNAATGVVSFSVAPGNGVAVSADCEFDVPARFGTDHLSARMESFGLHRWAEIPVVEVRV